MGGAISRFGNDILKPSLTSFNERHPQSSDFSPPAEKRMGTLDSSVLNVIAEGQIAGRSVVKAVKVAPRTQLGHLRIVGGRGA